MGVDPEPQKLGYWGNKPAFVIRTASPKTIGDFIDAVRREFITAKVRVNISYGKPTDVEYMFVTDLGPSEHPNSDIPELSRYKFEHLMMVRPIPTPQEAGELQSQRNEQNYMEFLANFRYREFSVAFHGGSIQMAVTPANMASIDSLLNQR